MKGPAIDKLIYDFMFPKPRSTDPQNFQGLLQSHLVPEVRLETQAFYGHLTSQEAKYPGLDYSYSPHRVRLSRYSWHRRLFRAFDNLGLTDSEIAGLTKWEGTRWAKERYEREQGIVIRDTTADGIEDWVEPELRNSTTAVAAPSDKHNFDLKEARADSHSREQLSDPSEIPNYDHIDERGIQDQVDEDVSEESDTELQSIGVALNERIRAVVAQREAGNSSMIMDEEWEQWFKEAVEAGGLSFLSTDFSPFNNLSSARQTSESQPSDTSSRPLNFTPLDQWHRTPDFLQGIIRQHSDSSNSTSNAVDGSFRRTSESSAFQRHFHSNFLNRGANMSSFHQHRSNTITPPRRLYMSSLGVNNRLRQWEAERASIMAISSSRPTHLSAIRTTQNRIGSSRISYHA